MPFWTNGPDRKSALDELGNSFGEMDLESTRSKLEALGSAVLVASALGELVTPLNEVIAEFEGEWGDSEYKERVCSSLHDLLLFYLRRPGSPADQQTIGSLIPNLEARQRAGETLRQFVTLAAGAVSVQSLYTQATLIYALTVEGIFDQTLRTLYFLAKLAQGSPVTFANSHSMNVQQLRGELARSSIISDSSVLFEGYDNHLRNSIAHFYSQFDVTTNAMTFEDHDPTTGSISWGPVIMTYSEFVNGYYSKIEDVSTYLSGFFGVIRARDLALAQGVP